MKKTFRQNIDCTRWKFPKLPEQLSLHPTKIIWEKNINQIFSDLEKESKLVRNEVSILVLHCNDHLKVNFYNRVTKCVEND